MKKTLNLLTVALIVSIMGIMAGCSDQNAKIQRMVDMFNSPEFKSELVSTGFISTSEAVEKDNSVVLTLKCTKLVDIAKLPESYKENINLMSKELFARSMAEPIISEGITALNAEKMNLILIWEDPKGEKLEVTINPEEIIKASATQAIDEPGADLAPEAIPSESSTESLTVTEP